MLWTSGTDIFVYGEIGNDGEYDGAIQPSDFARELEALAGERRINVHIHSGGGSVFGGIAMGNAIANMRLLGKTITAYIDGAAFSIASVIPLYSSKVYMHESGLLMVHLPTVGSAGGNAAELAKLIVAIEKATDQIVQMYVKKTGKSEKVIRDLMEKETWFTADEAKDFGFVDEVLTEKPRLAACCTIDHLNYSVPKEKRDAARRPVDKLIRTVLRETLAIEQGEANDDSLSNAIVAAESLTHKGGVTEQDLRIVASALERVQAFR